MKVNAYVDEGIAPLVVVLNSLDGVVTLDSCEAAPPYDAGMSFVSFQYGKNWRELAELLDVIGEQLRSNLHCVFSVRLEWLGSNDRARGQITLQREHVKTAAQALSAAIASSKLVASSTEHLTI